MSAEFIEILDTALDQLRRGKSIPKILAHYPEEAEYLEPLLQTTETLESIRSVEMPSHNLIVADRNDFLKKIVQLETIPVSQDLFARIKSWSGSLFRWPQINFPYLRKEKWNMSALLARTVLVIGLLFGATSGAYAMADNSLPNEPMYGAKLAMEQVRLNFETDPAGVAGRQMVMAQNRVQEIVRLAQKGTAPDAATMTRLETHLNTALQFAAQTKNDGEMLGLLTQAKAMVQAQVQVMTRAQVQGEGSLQEPLQLALRLLNRFQNQVEAGLQDPQGFRWQYQNASSDCPNCLCDGCEPVGDENKYGQTEEGAPGGPGGNPDCPSDDCVPIGDENKYGQTEEGAPKGPAGDTFDCPNCPCDGCEPVGDENKYGQTGIEPPGQPGGNPDCPCDDCEPVGDENQYGQTEEGAPGTPDGNPDCPSDDCVPVGDQNGPNKP